MTNYHTFVLEHRTNMAYGEKVTGTRHTRPATKAARHTGGLWAA